MAQRLIGSLGGRVGAVAPALAAGAVAHRSASQREVGAGLHTLAPPEPAIVCPYRSSSQAPRSPLWCALQTGQPTSPTSLLSEEVRMGGTGAPALHRRLPPAALGFLPAQAGPRLVFSTLAPSRVSLCCSRVHSRAASRSAGHAPSFYWASSSQALKQMPCPCCCQLVPRSEMTALWRCSSSRWSSTRWRPRLATCAVLAAAR